MVYLANQSPAVPSGAIYCLASQIRWEIWTSIDQINAEFLFAFLCIHPIFAVLKKGQGEVDEWLKSTVC
jgi:hypothetical protein